MSKIADLIEEAGARAEAVPTFARELLEALESRILALEASIVAHFNGAAPASDNSPGSAPVPAPVVEEAGPAAPAAPVAPAQS